MDDKKNKAVDSAETEVKDVNPEAAASATAKIQDSVADAGKARTIAKVAIKKAAAKSKSKTKSKSKKKTQKKDQSKSKPDASADNAKSAGAKSGDNAAESGDAVTVETSQIEDFDEVLKPEKELVLTSYDLTGYDAGKDQDLHIMAMQFLGYIAIIGIVMGGLIWASKGDLPDFIGVVVGSAVTGIAALFSKKG